MGHAQHRNRQRHPKESGLLPWVSSSSLRGDHWAEWPEGSWREALTPCTWTLPTWPCWGQGLLTGPETAAAGAGTPPSRLFPWVVPCSAQPEFCANYDIISPVTCWILATVTVSNLVIPTCLTARPCDKQVPWWMVLCNVFSPTGQTLGLTEDSHQTAQILGTESRRKYLMAKQMSSLKPVSHQSCPHCYVISAGLNAQARNWSES